MEMSGDRSEAVRVAARRALELIRRAGCWRKDKTENNGNPNTARCAWMMEKIFIHRIRAEAPNDPKLSDRRSGRGTCRWVERWWSAAGAVTAEPVRCSAWLGAFIRKEFLRDTENMLMK